MLDQQLSKMESKVQCNEPNRSFYESLYFPEYHRGRNHSLSKNAIRKNEMSALRKKRKRSYYDERKSNVSHQRKDNHVDIIKEGCVSYKDKRNKIDNINNRISYRYLFSSTRSYRKSNKSHYKFNPGDIINHKYKVTSLYKLYLILISFLFNIH